MSQNISHLKNIESIHNMDRWQSVDFSVQFWSIPQNYITHIKTFIEHKKENQPYWEIRNYNTKIIDPIELCDILLKYDNITVDILEELSENHKRCVADILLWTATLESLHKIWWDWLMLWIYCNAYPYGHIHDDLLPEYITNNVTVIWSEEKFNLFEKACNSFWRLHFQHKTYTAVMSMYKMQISLWDFLATLNIHHTLGSKFWLSALYSRVDAVLWREKSWWYKELDASWDVLKDKMLSDIVQYDREFSNGSRVDVVNRQSAYLSANFSWKRYLLYLDWPLWISITYNGQPVASIVFSLYDEKTLFVHQMQAVTVEHYDRYGRITKKTVDPIVNTISWQERLYDMVELYAQEMWLDYIMIQSAQNNKWTKQKQTVLDYDEHRQQKSEVDTWQPHFALENAQKIYDTFARNHNFHYEKNTKNFIKNMRKKE